MAEIRINTTGELKLYDSDDSNYVSFKSGGTVSSDVTWTLPTADGSSGQMLSTDGSGTLSWATASSADPSSADGDSLGTASAEWSDLFLADGGTIQFGNDQDVTLTHVADTALLLNAAMRLQFRDSGLYIGSNADGDLDIVSDGTAVDSINLESAGGITLDAGTASSGIVYEDDGTEMLRIHNSSSDVLIESKVQDKDIIFKGDDGGSVITALTLDMSAAGASAFNSYITSTAIYGKGDDNTGIQFDGSDVISYHTGGTNRMTMADNGDIHVPNTSASAYMTIKGGSSEPYVVHNGNATGTTTVYMFKVQGNEVGTINRTSSGTSYNTSSDYRLKENETAITDGIDRVKQLKPYRFNFKVNPSTKVDGFFAHEVSGIVPEAISGEKDGENMQGIDQSKLVPLLTGALQEAITKIETLETKVKALEG